MAQPGKLDWDSPELDGGKKDQTETKKIPFLNMKGNNKTWRVRVAGSPVMYY